MMNMKLKKALGSFDLVEEDGLDGLHLIHVMPMGTFTGFPDGKEFSLEDPQSVIDASKRENVELVIDYDHQTDLAPKGTKVVAAGWIKDWVIREDGLWALVSWTENASWQIRSKEYRYISPVFHHDGNGKIARILRASLTNVPRFDLKAVASQHGAELDELNFEDSEGDGETATDDETDLTETEKETPIMDKALLKALGLKEDATIEQAVDAVNNMQTAMASQTGANAKICEALGLGAEAKSDEVIETASQLKASTEPDPSKFVPIAMYTETASQLQVLQDNVVKEQASQLVEQAIVDGKVTPAQKDWAIGYASQKPKDFEDYLKVAPVIASSKETKVDLASQNTSELSEGHRKINKMMNVADNDVLKEIASQQASE